MYWTCNQMNNLLPYCGLVDAKIKASDKDLPVLHVLSCPTHGFTNSQFRIPLKIFQPISKLKVIIYVMVEISIALAFWQAVVWNYDSHRYYHFAVNVGSQKQIGSIENIKSSPNPFCCLKVLGKSENKLWLSFSTV